MKQIIILLFLIGHWGIVYSQPALENPTNSIENQPFPSSETRKTEQQIDSGAAPVISSSNIAAPSKADSAEYIITTNELYFSTNKVIMTNIKTDYMVNWGFFFLLEGAGFSEKFSRGTYGDGQTYYHIPSNSWNDNFYLVFSYDWKLPFLNGLNTRWGWSIGINLAGSGNGKNTIKVEPNTDLGKVYGSDKGFYLIYNDYKFPVLLNLRFQPFSFSIFDFYMGAGAGLCLNIITYNELQGEEESSFESAARKSFFPIKPMGKIFFGISFKTIEELQEIFLEINYQIIENPIVASDFQVYEPETKSVLGGYKRSTRFQIAGLSLGFGFRF